MHAKKRDQHETYGRLALAGFSLVHSGFFLLSPRFAPMLTSAVQIAFLSRASSSNLVLVELPSPAPSQQQQQLARNQGTNRLPTGHVNCVRGKRETEVQPKVVLRTHYLPACLPTTSCATCAVKVLLELDVVVVIKIESSFRTRDRERV